MLLNQSHTPYEIDLDMVYTNCVSVGRGIIAVVNHPAAVCSITAANAPTLTHAFSQGGGGQGRPTNALKSIH